MRLHLNDLTVPWGQHPDWQRWMPAVFPLLCALISYISFYAAMQTALSAVRYFTTDGTLYVIPGVVMEYFPRLLKGTNLTLLFYLAICVSWAADNYLGAHRNTKSVYLMRRLPDRWEYHRRCVGLPLLAALLCILLRLVLIPVFFQIYLHATPMEALPPMARESFLSNLFPILFDLSFGR